MKNGILINFSGHALSQDAIDSLSEQYKEIIQAAPINFDFTDRVEEQLENLIVSLSCQIDGTQPITIIPPGQSTLSILLVTYLHGLMGNFPAICYLELSDSGIYLPKMEFSINSNHVRSAGRKFRAKVFAA
jgi:hypothetical protein